MNPETKQGMEPRIEPATEPPRTEPPQTAVPAAETAPALPKRKRSFLWMFFDAWTDRDLDLSNIDTSDWNIYYYYYRHIYQKRATIKLKYLRWIALLFQILFFGAYALGITLYLIFHIRRSTTMDLSGIFLVILSVGNMFALQYLLPLFPFLPIFMVCPAFKLRSRNRGFMTSRAKEPPLLAHLVRYTTSRGLVTGALQSLFFTWRKFFLLLLPCIVVSVLSMFVYASFFASTAREITMTFALPAGGVLFILTLSMFFVMQAFCYRMDSLLMIIYIGILAAITVFEFGDRSSAFNVDFWLAMGCCYVPACILASVYFALAAVDTNDYGLGKRAPKAIRIFLYSLAGIFLALILSGGNLPLLENADSNHYRLIRLILSFCVYGLFACVCGLLVTSVSVTSHHAELLRRKQPGKPFWRKLLDPASPVSLCPVFVLEIASFFIVGGFSNSFARSAHSGFSANETLQFARAGWTVLHVALAAVYMRQWNDPAIREPWESHVKFNSYAIFSAVLLFLIMLLFSLSVNKKDLTDILASFIYIASIIAWGFAVYYVNSHPDRKRFEQSGAPADAFGGGTPGQGRDDREAL
ncbi:MAG: hypothetical protein IKO02_01025 [Lentisphaeria bacterium]|nr:hypothetical protein [Lentisphaeria bacterium]